MSQKDETEASKYIPAKADRDIRNAWIAAILVNTLTLSGVMGWVYGITLLDIFDVVLVFGLAYGIYRKSRACAAIMLAYFLIQKTLFMLIAGLPIGMVISLVFVYFFVQGLIGTIDYHSNQEPGTTSSPSGGV